MSTDLSVNGPFRVSVLSREDEVSSASDNSTTIDVGEEDTTFQSTVDDRVV